MRLTMTMTMTILVMAGLAVSACGKKGALQPPPAEDAPVERPRPLF